MGVFTLFTLFTLFFDSAGLLFECKNSFVKVRRFVLRVYYSTNVLICKSNRKEKYSNYYHDVIDAWIKSSMIFSYITRSKEDMV